MVGTNLNTLLMNNNFAVLISVHLNDPRIHDPRLRNEMATTELERDLKLTGLRYYPMIGMYEGVEETSFIVFCNDIFDVMRVEVLGLDRHNQESVLILDLGKQIALLKYADNVSMIGRGLTQVDSIEGLSAYSIIDGDYWIVE